MSVIMLYLCFLNNTYIKYEERKRGKRESKMRGELKKDVLNLYKLVISITSIKNQFEKPTEVKLSLLSELSLTVIYSR